MQNLSHQDVAYYLNKSRIFLSFGHPEGFGLRLQRPWPLVVGLLAIAVEEGDELFRYGASYQVSFGDWSGFLRGIQDAIDAFTTRSRETDLRLRRQALAVSSLYSIDQERASIKIAWESIAKAFFAYHSNLTK